MRTLHRSVITALLVAVSAVTAARGDSLLVGNLGDSPAGSDTIGPGSSRAQGFMTGNRAWNLTSIDAVLGDLNAAATVDVSATLVGSTTDSNGDDVPDPSNTLATFTFPPVGASFSTLSFALPTSIVLQADTEYWFVLQATSADAPAFQWRYTNDTALDPGSEGALTSAAVTIPPGSTGAGDWTSQPNAPYLIGINGTPVVASVPEPSSWLMGGVGLACVFGLVRRRAALAAG